MPKKPLLLFAAMLMILGLIASTLRIVESRRAILPSSSQAELDFTDVSREAGINKEYGGKETYGPLWGDLNGDGWVDLIFMDHGGGPSLYLNQNGNRFVDEFVRSGVRSGNWQYPQQGDRHGGACADYDNDGDVDLFIAHGALRGDTLGIKYDELLKNAGDAKFEEVSHEAGTLNSEGRARTPIWTDYDNDGLLDLYISNLESRNVLYKNQGDGTFTDVSSKTRLDMEEANSHIWFDYDNDEDIDVLLTWPIQTYVNNVMLFQNDGDGEFLDVTSKFASSMHPVPGPRGIAAGDYDNDGFTDLFIAANRPNQSDLYRNNKGTFETAGGSFGPDESQQGGGPVWGDIDNDGDLDLLTIDGSRLRFFENRSGAKLIEAPLQTDTILALSRSSELALADFDNDGYLDLAVNGSDRQYLLKNLHSGNSWIKIIFRGSESNRMGFGAKVWVTSDDKTVFRQYLGDTGFYRSAGCGPLHIGLGQSSTVDLRVLWPSGKERRMKDVQANQTVQVVEP